jgi:outer membrane lipoprotein-sorting protein
MRTEKLRITAAAAGLLALPLLYPLPLASGAAGAFGTAGAAGGSGASEARGDAAELDRIVAAVIAAQGGKEKLAAVKSRRESGRMTLGTDAGGPLVVELARPGKMRMELTVQGKTFVRTYDGAAGWQLNPFAAGEAAALSGEELTNISHEADFDGPWIDAKARGIRIELAGKEKVEGQDAYRLQVTLKGGDVDFYYFDAATYRKVRWEGTRHQNGKAVIYETAFHDFRPVAGLVLPFRIDSGVKGAPASAHIVLTSIELDPPLAEARFGKPAAPPAVPPP